MKRILLRLFLRRPVIAQIAAAAASAASAYGMTFIPGAPEIVRVILAGLLQLPEGTQLTQAGLAAAITPILLAAINAVVQEMAGRGNNAVLSDLQDAGVYNGSLDRVIGPVAKAAVDRLIDQGPRIP